MTYFCRAAVMHKPGEPFQLQDIQLSEPAYGEVLVRTVSAGICGTDLHFARGTVPFPVPTVLGHEAAGVVEAIGAGVSGFKDGDRVIVCDQTFCGRCAACLTGRMVYCTDPGTKQRQKTRMTIDGRLVRQYLGVSAFAELMLVDEAALVAMPAGLSFDAAALLGCCLTTGLAAVFNVARPAPGSTVAVFGCGGVGLAAVQAARISGAAETIAVDLEPHRREIAAKLGATVTIDPADGDVTKQVLAIAPGGVDAAIEAVGLAETTGQAFAVLRPGGQATVLGMMPPGTEIRLPAALLRHGRGITGTVMGSVRTRFDIPRYAALAMRGTLRSEEIITSSRPLHNVNEAMADAEARQGIRSMIHF
ncbi:zinc-binding dehydrogenase [Solwaraspora sp. WMMD792]|uniref:zinc-binding dehydrogenase n=1 Tax=Solwaraspora sp. WMMD792 TaxID=3016099 RepID=UPI0024180F8E|nr:zinc-binding dehydrogenase [Solwaraspora sp. WMMD792]MDG4773538.1 zinc-binding dehydrogenase [Solwaraspora sp. WMMD792]